MTDPDDPLTGIELDAWEPPTPPGGIADAVLRRMSEPVAVAAHELAERPRLRRRLWIGAGALGGRSPQLAIGNAMPRAAAVGGPASAGHRSRHRGMSTPPGSGPARYR